jgi:hypothetical protein
MAVRLPPFSAERPAVCFAQAEAQFFLAGISSDKIKSCHVILQVDHWYAAELEDITSPPGRDPYTTLRTADEAAVSFESAVHPPALYARDGRQ